MALGRLELRVQGMDCADCARSIERGVAALPGVSRAAVSFTGSELAVEYDGSATDRERIAGRVRELGYGVEEPRSDGLVGSETGRPFWMAHPRAIATGLSGLAVAGAGAAAILGGPDPIVATLSVTAVVLGGHHVARAGWASLRLSRTLDMNALMTVAVLGALVLGEWIEAGTVVFLFSLGNTLESMTVERARGAIRHLMALAPSEARVRRDGAEITIPVAEARVGDVVRVRPGERLPLDGEIVDGFSTVNEAPITGESTPVDKGPGSAAFAGSINGSAYLEVRATRPYEDTTIARVIRLVEEAQARRAPAQRLVDRFSARYTPAVIALAVLMAVVPPVLFGGDSRGWIYKALVLLVIACPCALVISTPVAIVAGLTRAARDGILIKGGAHLEALGAVRAIAFDKTGTLTFGRPEVAAALGVDGWSTARVLAVAAAVEVRSEHPLANAIVRHARHEGIDLDRADGFEALPGKGTRALVGGHAIAVGAPRWLTKEGVDLTPISTLLLEQEEAGRTVLAVAVDGRAVGVIGLDDRVRPGAAAAIAALRAGGIRHIAILTGDNRRAAAAVASSLDVGDVRAGLLPEEKVAAVRTLIEEHGSVAMLGDGVNDAPALAAATVGIAMGAAGSAVALETADVALMADDLERLPQAVLLARATLGTVRANIVFSLATKALFLALATFGFAGLWLAVLADMGTSLLVTLNGMRLLRDRA